MDKLVEAFLIMCMFLVGGMIIAIIFELITMGIVHIRERLIDRMLDKQMKNYNRYNK